MTTLVEQLRHLPEHRGTKPTDWSLQTSSLLANRNSYENRPSLDGDGPPDRFACCPNHFFLVHTWCFNAVDASDQKPFVMNIVNT